MPAIQFQLLLNHMPPGKIREDILRFKRWQDAHASLVGKCLLVQAMRHLGQNISLADIRYSAHGRPFVEGAADFNISHSGKFVVCLVSDEGRAGIDIEEEAGIDYLDFQPYFSEEEWNTIIGSPSRETTFYRLWTRKEAVIKADGRGLSVSLPDLDVMDSEHVTLNNQVWHIAEIKDFEHHICHVAGSSPVKDPALIKLDLEQYYPATL